MKNSMKFKTNYKNEMSNIIKYYKKNVIQKQKLVIKVVVNNNGMMIKKIRKSRIWKSKFQIYDR